MLADVAPDQLAPWAPALMARLLPEATGGRLWEGKEGLLAATGSLAAACAPTLAQQPGALYWYRQRRRLRRVEAAVGCWL